MKSLERERLQWGHRSEVYLSARSWVPSSAETRVREGGGGREEVGEGRGGGMRDNEVHGYVRCSIACLRSKVLLDSSGLPGSRHND